MNTHASHIAAPSETRLTCVHAGILWLLASGAVHAAEVTAHGALRADQPGAPISRYIFGQFAEHLDLPSKSVVVLDVD
jgi:hypothetical protein